MSSRAGLELVVSYVDKGASKGLAGLAKQSSFLKNALSFATGGALLHGIGALGGAVSDFFGSAMEEAKGWEAGLGQLDSVLASTGGKAGVTRKQVLGLADSLSAAGGLSQASDDAVLAGANMLLTFGNVGKDVFPQATQAALDMATAMNNGLGPSSEQLVKTNIQLGKALNDPIKGISALSKVGVSFTKQQKDQIKTLVESGRVMDAQKLILAELSAEFGGSAAASAKTFTGRMKTLEEQFNNVKQGIGEKLMPVVGKFLDMLSSPAVTSAINMFSGALIDGIGAAFDFISSPAIMSGISQVAALIGTILVGAWNLLSQAVQVVGPIAAGFFSGLMVAVGALLPIVQNVFQFIGENAGAIAVVLTAILAPAFTAWAISAGAAALATIVAFAPVVLAIGAIAGAAALLKLAWDSNFLGIQETVGTWWASISTAFNAVLDFFEPLTDAVGDFFEAISDGQPFLDAMGDLLGNLGGILSDMAGKIAGWALETAGNAIVWAGGIAGGIFAGIGSMWDALWGTGPAWAEAIWGWVARTATDALVKAADIGSKIVDGIAQGWNDAWKPDGFATKIYDWLREVASQVLIQGAEIGGRIIDGIGRGFLFAIASVFGLVTIIWDWIANMAKDAYTKAMDVGKAIIDGIIAGFKAYDFQVGENLREIFKFLPEQKPESKDGGGIFDFLGKAAENAMNAVGSAFKAATAAADLKAMGAAAEGALKSQWGISSPSKVFLSIGLMAMLGLSSGLITGGGTARASALSVGANVRVGVAGPLSPGQFVSVGAQIPLGLARGITASTGVAVAAARSMAIQVANASRTTLGIKSPSKVFEEIAHLALEGMAQGMGDNAFVLQSTEASINQVIALAKRVATKGTEELMKSFGSIMDDMGKVFGALSSMGDPDAKMPVAATFKSFFDAFDALIPQIQFRLLRWRGAFDEEKANLSKFIGEAVNGFLGAVSGFEKLGDPDILWPTKFAFDAFFVSFDAFIPDLQFRLLRWAGAFDTAKAELAKAVGDATNGILGAITGFEKLGDPKLLWPVQFAIDAFFITFDAFVPDLQFRILRWLGAFDPVKAELSKAIGDSVNGILGALTGFAHLADPKLLFPIQFAVDAFFITFDAFIPDLQFRILRWLGAFDQTKAQLTKDIGDAVNGILGALSGLLKLGDPKNLYPTQFAITGFFLVLDQFLSEFERYAEAWLSKAPGVLSELSTKIGETAAGIGKAFDPILKMPDIAKIDRGQIEGAFSNLWFALHQLNEVMKSGELQGDWQARATEFSATIATIGDALRTGLGAITDLGKTEGGGFAALFTDLRTLWMGVFGPATQEGTFLYAIFGKPNGMFNWMDTNIPIYMGFSAGVWKQALQGLQAAIGAELAVMKVALYNDTMAVGQSLAEGLAQGILDNSGGVTDALVKAVLDAIDAAKRAAGIGSPSKVAAQQVGFPMAQGVAQGILAGVGLNASAMQGLVNGVMNPAYAGVPVSGSGVPIPRGQGNGATYGGHSFHIEVHAGLGSDGQSIANAVMDAIGDKLYQDRAVRGNG